MKRTVRNALIGAGLLALAGGALAQVYKWVDKKGVTHYSDQPPEPGSGSKVQVKSFDGSGGSVDVPYALAEAMRLAPVTLFTTTPCEACDGARALLQSRGVPYTEKTVSSAEDRDALQAAGGANQLPFIVVGRKHLTGFDAGSLNSALTDASYPGQRLLPAGFPLGSVGPAAPPPPKPQAAPQESSEAAPDKVPPKPPFQF